jgi:autotransporter-associated beta strand protein
MKTFPVLIRMQSFAITVLATVTAFFATVQLAGAAGTTVWSGGAGANQNWSAAGNWTSSGGSTPPAAGDTVFFGAAGNQGAAGTIDNIVDAGFTVAPGSLFFSNEVANTYHTTQISSGTTLTISGVITVGGTNNTSTYAFTGGGTLKGGSGTSVFTVASEGSASANSSVLDLSSLSNFIWNAGGAGGTFNLGLDSGFMSAATLKLAATSNNITATTVTISHNNNGSTPAAILSLGAGTNIINADTFQVGEDKTTGTINFVSSSGGLRQRNAAGTGRSTFSVGDSSHTGSASGTFTSSVLLGGHYVDMMISTLTLANRHARSGGGHNAFFSFNAGIVDVNGLVMAINNTNGGAANGTMSVGGGQLKVGNIMVGNSGGTPGTGTLQITNTGSVVCSTNILKGTNCFATISMNGGALTMSSVTGSIGALTNGLDNMNLTNATLHFNLNASARITNAIVTNLNLNGQVTIQIDSVLNVGSATLFTNIQYVNLGGPGSIVAQAPAGYTATASVGGGFVTVTISPPASEALVWNGFNSGDWDTATTNWVDTTANMPTNYFNGDFLTFDDTANNFNVNLTSSFAPGGITLNNTANNYTFSGIGGISGSGKLEKDGTGSLLLDNTGANTFSGGFVINNGGTVQVGNNDGGGGLGLGGVTNNNSTLIFNRTNNNFTVANAISGSGTLIQNGSGTLILSGANTYTGPTYVNAGTLVLNGSLSGPLTNLANTILTGSGTNSGVSDVAGTLLPGGSNTLGRITLAGLQLESGAAATFDFATNNLGGMTNDLLMVNGNLSANANKLSINSPQVAPIVGTYPIINYTGSLIGSFNQTVGGTHTAVTLNTNVLGVVSVTFSGGNGANLVWDNNSGNNQWDVGGSQNWLNGVAQDYFYQNDTVLLDDTAGSSTLTLNGTVYPAAFTNKSTANNYSINGSGKISGATAIVKDGTSTLTLSNANDFTGPVTVLNGVLRVGNNSALGTTNGTTTIASGASLDVFAHNVGQEQIYVSGTGKLNGNGTTNGAIYNSGGVILQAVARVTLLGDTVFGGPVGGLTVSNRWDLRSSATGDANGASLTVPTPGTKLTKTGNNQVSFTGVTVDNNLGDIDVQAGVLSIESATTGLGDTNYTLTVENNADLSIFNATNQFNKKIVVNGNGVVNNLGSFNNTSGNNTIVGSMTLNGTVAVTYRTLAGVVNQAGSLTFSNTIIGAGSLNKYDTNALILAGPAYADNHSGGTVVGDGDGDPGGILILNTINTNTANALIEFNSSLGPTNFVGGNGTNAGPVTIEDTLWPGVGGKFSTFGSGSIDTGGSPPRAFVWSLGSTTNVGGGFNDLLNINGDLDTAGTIPIFINPVGLLTNGVYTLVKYTGNLISGFSGNNIFIYNGAPTRFTFSRDQSVPGIITLSVTGGMSLMEWNNGDVSNSGKWDVQGSQNWTNLLSPTLNAVDHEFLQGDAVLLDDNITNAANPVTAITIASNIAVMPMVITNDSTVNYSVSGAGKISGAGKLVKAGTSTLTLSNTNDFTGPVTVLGGVARLLNIAAAGSGAMSVTNGAMLVVGGTPNNTITLGGATLGGVSGITSLNGELTSVTGTANVIYTADPQNPAVTAEMNFTNTLHGGGNLLVVAGSNVNSPDGGVGFRLRGTGSSDYTGTITVSNNVKAELQTTVAGPFSPANTAKIVMYGGAYDATNTQTGPASGGYSEMNLRNNSTANTTLGNNIELAGSGLVVLNPVGSAPASASVAMGNLKIGGGQQVGIYLGSTNSHTVIFSTVTLTGGNATFSPRIPAFGTTNAANTGDLQLGPISQTAPSGIIMNGLRTLTLTGANTYSGNTVVSNGTLALAGGATISSSPSVMIAPGAIMSVANSAALSGCANLVDNGELDVTALPASTMTLNNGETMSGTGHVSGLLTAPFGSTVSPGSSGIIGTLTVSSMVTLQGMTYMEVTNNGAQFDVLHCGSVNYGGTLVVSNLDVTHPFTSASSFQLFSAGVYSGGFANILPPTPGNNLVWDTSALGVNGVLKVANASNGLIPTNSPAITNFSIAGLNVVIDGTNGQAGGTYYLLQNTNLAAPFNQWKTAATNVVGTANQFTFIGTNVVNTNAAQQYFILSNTNY